ncbi:MULTISPECIES: TRAP transporter small permease [unclassified Romboutsia]|uniref:TRAP transporter small permease n=1 Tax=unclassified Romboutsia TaxID=2626894 RepID=UPI000821903F|nr:MULTISPECIES: TRAP transporter small permease [unclassified Romboutsia]SCH90768.1 2%2C3-diketo-L-gulonate TRAP transporter small permease protein yiaM [uncultured Clostridium sp.]
MEALRKGLDKILEVVCCILLSLMTIFATWQVASRYIFNKPSTVTEELVLICFVWMGLLGAAYVFGKQEHMRMSFLVDKLSERNQTKVKLFSEIVVILFAALVLVFGGLRMSQLSMGQTSSSLQIPMGYIYLALPLSGIVTIIYNILNISDIIKELSSGKEVKNKNTKTA